MQATLLSLGIALILALVAALVGPHFVDWSQYRSTFEAEASRLTGIPVRIAGPIDAQLLPTPSLAFKNVELGAGAEADTPHVRARELSIEFRLGPLLRGNWRASELRLLAPEINVGLDRNGSIGWLQASVDLLPEQLAIDRLVIEAGRIALTDAASEGRLVLDQWSFTGEIRSLLGPAKGEGGFETGGARYRYALAASRTEDELLKLHVELAPAGGSWTAEADGSVHFVSAAPEFDGSLTLARPAGLVDAAGHGATLVPWRGTGHVKATAASALFDKAEFQYGPDERALRLNGVASLRFGKEPYYEAVISGRRLDLDGLLASREPAARLPSAVVQELTRLSASGFQLPVPGRLGIGIDDVTLAGGQLRDLRGDLRSDARGWDIEHLEFRAPGFTSARLSGRLDLAAHGASFHGPVSMEASDSRALLTWLEGHSSAHVPAGVLRASGDVTLGSDRIVVDRLQAHIDRKEFGGRIFYAYPLDSQPARMELEIKAAELDLDELAGLVPAMLAGSKPNFPGSLLLAAEIDRAAFAGVEARNASVKLSYDANGLVLDRLSVGDLGGASVKLSGQLRSLLSTQEGGMKLELKATTLEGIAAIMARFGPSSSEFFQAAIGRLAPLDLRADLVIGGDNRAKHPSSRLTLDGTAGAARLHVVSEANGNPLDLDAIELKLDGTLTSNEGAQLLGLLGLARAFNLEKGPGSIRLGLGGRPAGDLELDAQLTANGLTARAKGTAQLRFQGGSGAGLDVAVLASDAAPLLGRTAPGRKLPVNLKARLSLSADKLDCQDIVASIEDTSIRGRLSMDLAAAARIDGQIEADEIAVPALLAGAVGLPAQALARDGLGATQPFEAGLFGRLAGRIEFGAARAILAPGFVSRELHGLLRLDPGEIAFERLEAKLGEGRMRGELTFQRDGAATNTHARITLAEVDTSALAPGSVRGAVKGRLTLQFEADGSGSSPATLVGSLKGGGTVSIESARLAGLDPHVFEAAIGAADRGLAITPAKISAVVGPALAAGELAIARADGALTIAAGQARVSNIIAHGEGADLTLSGALDLASGAIDARLTLSGPPDGGAPGTARPDLFVALRGSAASPQRSVDVSALVNWLMLRSLDRETRRIEAIEPGRHDPSAAAVAPPGTTGSAEPPLSVDPSPEMGPAGSTAAPPQPQTLVVPETSGPAEAAPSLPPPVEIRPAPGTGRGARLKEGAPTRPLARDATGSRQPQNRSFFERLFGPHH